MSDKIKLLHYKGEPDKDRINFNLKREPIDRVLYD